MKTPKSFLHNSYRPAFEEAEMPSNKNLDAISSDQAKANEQKLALPAESKVDEPVHI